MEQLRCAAGRVRRLGRGSRGSSAARAIKMEEGMSGIAALPPPVSTGSGSKGFSQSHSHGIPLAAGHDYTLFTLLASLFPVPVRVRGSVPGFGVRRQVRRARLDV